MSVIMLLIMVRATTAPMLWTVIIKSTSTITPLVSSNTCGSLSWQQ